MRSLAWMLLALVASVAWPAAAQDLPGRVGRLAWIEGTVAVYQDPDRGWDTAWLNTPLTSENSVWTEPGSRAEVRVGPIAVRLDEASQLDVSRLDDQTLDATLVRGMMAVRVRHFRRGDLLRLSTPQASFLLQGDGRYRLEADADRGESRLTVFTGVARMESASGTLRIPAGQSVVVWGEDRPHYAFQDAFTLEFDRWSLARDERLVERTASRYVSYEMTGYEDLDRYGEWIEEPVYGALWFPTRVAADWAPYRYGRWTYVRPWGWTWVDEAPWGYAPFHYGRWVHLRDRWAWAPGKRVERPTWAPALVGFVGGEGWSATVRSGGGPVVGWYPLAPSEAYRPWYNASPTYVNRVNIVVVNVPERVRQEHREFNRERGTTAVNRETLIAQRPVAQALVPVTRQAAASAPTLARPNTVLPSATEMREARRRTGSEAARAPAPPPPSPTATAPAARGERGRAASAPSAQPAPGANAMARPAFSRPSVAPAPAPQGATPPSPTAPLSRAPSAPGAAPAQRAAQPAPGVQTPQPPPAASQPLGRPGSPQRPERENGKPAPGATPATPAQPSGRGVPATPAVPATPPSAAARGAPSGADVFNPGRARADEAQEQQRAREAQQQQERTSREAQQRAAQEQQQRAAQEQRAREAQQAQQRAAQEQQQRAAQEQQQRAAQEQQRAREAQQAQQRAAQEQQQRAAQEQQRTREAQQAQQRAAQEQQQRAAQEQQRAREAQQAQQRAAQEQQQRAAQEQQRAREAQQAQQRAAQEQQQRAAQEQRAREAQQAQQRAAQEQQQRAQQGLQRPAPAPATAPEQAQKPQPPQAARPVPPAREKDKDKEKDKDNKDDKPSR